MTGTLEVYVDGSYLPRSGKGAAGVVLMSGISLLGTWGQQVQAASSLDAEAWAIYLGLRIAREYGCREARLCTDHAGLFRNLQAPEQSFPECCPDIRALLAALPSVEFVLVKSGDPGNRLAHAAARLALSNNSSYRRKRGRRPCLFAPLSP